MSEWPKTTDAGCLPSEGSRRETVSISTGSRLHFGLLDTAPPFGGAGVMIDEPKTEVVVRSSGQFVCNGEDRKRIESIAGRIAQVCGESALPKCEVEVIRRPPPHSGLGSGTQLSLAVAEAIACLLGCDCEAEQVACQYADRGKRSAVGSHGYFQGGLIYEDGIGSSDLNPIVSRIELPASWRVVVVAPAARASLVSGESEAAQFDQLPRPTERQSDTLRTMLAASVVPAAREGNFRGFADAVHQYNRASGELFASAQGGPYHGPHVTELVKWMIAQGAQGVGQSSWGPGVFAWFESDVQWQAFRSKLPKTVCTIAETRVHNVGRLLQTNVSPPKAEFS